MSQLKVDTITDELGTGAPNFPNGIANGFLRKGAPILITESGTYTPDADVRAIWVEVWGAGGAGGGASGGGAGFGGIAGGGGAGGYSALFIASVSASYTASVGAGGGGVPGGAGGAGGATTFVDGAAVSVSGSGGAGAGARPATAALQHAPGGLGGAGSGGDINLSGGRGRPGQGFERPNAQPDGGVPPILSNAGGEGASTNGLSDQRIPGGEATGFAAGGGGAAIVAAASSVERSGGAGGNGLIRIWEFV